MSNHPQTGVAGQTPTESVAYLANGTPTFYGVAVLRTQGQFPVVEIDLFVTTSKEAQRRIQYVVPGQSLSTPADSLHAITVGAIGYASPFALRSYSSQGPTKGPGGVAAGGFGKPDISAYDGVFTASYGTLLGRPFDGTSAAAPHVAGAIALGRSFYPGIDRPDLSRIVKRRAIDLGAPGFDVQHGYGRLFLGSWPSDFDDDGILDDGSSSGAAGDARCAGGATLSCDDNCPFFANTSQGDVGGLGSGSPLNGIGNDCQCGDVTANGFVTMADSTVILRANLSPPTATMTRPDLCDVGGAETCSTADSVIIERALLVPPTAAIEQQCSPARPPLP